MTDSPVRAPAGTPSVGPGRIRGFAVAAIAVVGHPVGTAALVIMLALVTATSAAYTVDAQGLGGLVYGIVAIGLILIIIAGPVARGARPLRVWIWQIFGATFLLLSLFARMVPFSIGPLRYIDIAYFSGYACLIVWLATMARHIGEPTSRITVLDSVAVTVGVSLAVWTTTLAPLVGASHLPSALVWAVYPIVDAVLLALAGHHAYRIGAKIPAMRWLLGALAFLLAVDIVNSSLGILYAVEEQPAVTGAYLFFFVFLTKAATHPSVVELSRPSTIRRTRRVGHRRTALILFVISPAIVASAVPAAGVVDIVVRTALVAVLLALLFARLSTAMGRSREPNRTAVIEPCTIS